MWPNLRAEHAADVGNGDRLPVDDKLVDFAVVVDFKGEFGRAIFVGRDRLLGPGLGLGLVVVDNDLLAIVGQEDLAHQLIELIEFLSVLGPGLCAGVENGPRVTSVGRTLGNSKELTL